MWDLVLHLKASLTFVKAHVLVCMKNKMIKNSWKRISSIKDTP